MKRKIFLFLAIISVVGMVMMSGCKKKETYTVTFNANGGSGTMAAQTFTEGEAQALTRNVFTYDGYTFSGWNTVQGGSGASYSDGQTITATSDMTLYAQWTGNPVTVTFDANGGTGEMAPQTFTIGTAQALDANIFTRENYNYKDWNTAADGSGTTYENSQEITISESTTLYAQWEIITYTVTFEPNGGTGDMPVQIFNVGESQNLATNVFTRNGYTFCGWYTTDRVAYSDGQSITLTSDITLYARWFSAEGNGSVESHNFVDLGLPSGTKWATCNVGSTTPEGYGDYFAWGETTTKETYNWSTYKYCNGDYNTFTKYCYNAEYGDNGYTDALTTLEAIDDAATANWGSGWRMPTQDEVRELRNNCTHEWTTLNGVNGRLFTGPNGNSIFLPASGSRGGSELYSAGSTGHCWSSSLGTLYPGYACGLLILPGGCMSSADDDRDAGFPVRPVCASQN
jgi:uncharacterized repeat protein (TIGR02543 family)